MFFLLFIAKCIISHIKQNSSQNKNKRLKGLWSREHLYNYQLRTKIKRTLQSFEAHPRRLSIPNHCVFPSDTHYSQLPCLIFSFKDLSLPFRQPVLVIHRWMCCTKIDCLNQKINVSGVQETRKTAESPRWLGKCKPRTTANTK